MTDKQIADELFDILVMLKGELEVHSESPDMYELDIAVWYEARRRAKLANPTYRL